MANRNLGYLSLVRLFVWPPRWTWTILCIAWLCVWHRLVGTVKRIDRGPVAVLVAVFLALSTAVPARADSQDDRFFDLLMERGIQAEERVLQNVPVVCGRVAAGQSVDELAVEVDAIEPDADLDMAKTFVLTVLQVYCVPDAHKMRDRGWF